MTSLWLAKIKQETVLASIGSRIISEDIVNYDCYHKLIVLCLLQDNRYFREYFNVYSVEIDLAKIAMPKHLKGIHMNVLQ